MATFPDLVKDPADVVNYTMDWTSRLPTGVKIVSSVVTVNGDITVTDKTSYGGGVTSLTLQVSGGSGFGFTGDNDIADFSVVSIAVTLADGEIMSRSFNVRVQQR